MIRKLLNFFPLGVLALQLTGCGAALLRDSQGSMVHDRTGSEHSTIEAQVPVQHGDSLEVISPSDPRMSGIFTVDSHGFLELPNGQSLAVQGLTPTDIEEALLHQGWGHDVSVRIHLRSSERIAVSGAVRRPGLITVREPLTISQVIVAAGGATAFADADHIEIVRRTGEQWTRWHVVLGEFDGGALIHPGDAVIVRSKFSPVENENRGRLN